MELSSLETFMYCIDVAIRGHGLVIRSILEYTQGFTDSVSIRFFAPSLETGDT